MTKIFGCNEPAGKEKVIAEPKIQQAHFSGGEKAVAIVAPLRKDEHEKVTNMERSRSVRKPGTSKRHVPKPRG